MLNIKKKLQRKEEAWPISSPWSVWYIKGLYGIWNEANWRSYIPSEQEIVEQNKLNIYPNPFQISKTGNRPFVTFEYKSDTDGEITIFDFSMNMVNSFNCTQDHNILENIKFEWYGENINGINVANGVYFCRLKTEKSEVWGKVMVVNLSGGDYE